MKLLWLFLCCRPALGGLDDTSLDNTNLDNTSAPPRNHPAIHYSTSATQDPVAKLNQRLRDGSVKLSIAGPTGHLTSVLKALKIPLESQVVVYSKTSRQLSLIDPRNPRAIFFNDSAAVALMRGGILEAASLDPEKGVVFYTLNQFTKGQRPAARPRFERDDSCLLCHLSDQTLGVAGMMVRSVLTGVDGSPRLLYGASDTDHRSPLEERWGGWYVTGSSGGAKHMGNILFRPGDTPEDLAAQPAIQFDSLKNQFDTSGYLSPYSDIAALMVFNHQMRMTNLLVRLGWEARAGNTAVLESAAGEVVDYLLFLDEAPLRAPISGAAGFEKKFAAAGPRDSKGRSLRDLDLTHRLLRYPCSYMIYSDVFEALPATAKDAVYRRLWQILSASESSLSAADRRAIIEILKETKPSLPAYFAP